MTFGAVIVMPIAAYQLLVNDLPLWVVVVSTALGLAAASLVALRFVRP
jgi:hypothetical protein